MEEILSVHTDGGSRGNPGPAGAGVVIKNAKGKVIREVSKFLGRCTNNWAEYEAVIIAFETLKRMLGAKSKLAHITLYMDSELIVRQLTGKYQIKEVSLYPQFIKVHNFLVKEFPHVTFKHVPREENKEADALANRAMDGA